MRPRRPLRRVLAASARERRAHPLELVGRAVPDDLHARGDGARRLCLVPQGRARPLLGRQQRLDAGDHRLAGERQERARRRRRRGGRRRVLHLERGRRLGRPRGAAGLVRRLTADELHVRRVRRACEDAAHADDDREAAAAPRRADRSVLRRAAARRLAAARAGRPTRAAGAARRLLLRRQVRQRGSARSQVRHHREQRGGARVHAAAKRHVHASGGRRDRLDRPARGRLADRARGCDEHARVRCPHRRGHLLKPRPRVRRADQARPDRAGARRAPRCARRARSSRALGVRRRESTCSRPPRGARASWR